MAHTTQTLHREYLLGDAFSDRVSQRLVDRALAIIIERGHSHSGFFAPKLSPSRLTGFVVPVLIGFSFLQPFGIGIPRIISSSRLILQHLHRSAVITLAIRPRPLRAFLVCSSSIPSLNTPDLMSFKPSLHTIQDALQVTMEGVGSFAPFLVPTGLEVVHESMNQVPVTIHRAVTVQLLSDILNRHISLTGVVTIEDLLSSNSHEGFNRSSLYPIKSPIIHTCPVHTFPATVLVSPTVPSQSFLK